MYICVSRISIFDIYNVCLFLSINLSVFKAEVARDKCVEEDTVNRKAKEARLRKEGKGKKTKEQVNRL